MPRVHVLSFDPAAVNSGVVIGQERGLIIDSGPGPSAASHLYDRAVEISEHEHGHELPVDIALTHDHWDHFFGTAALLDAGAHTVHASASFAADQEATAWIALHEVRGSEESDSYLAELPEDPSTLVVPVTPIDESSGAMGTLDLGGSIAEFHVLGGHSTADLVVRLPDVGIVFVGDLLEEAGRPQAGPDASLSEWARSLAELLSFPEAEIFVPGHGVPVDRDFAKRQLDDINGLRLRQDDGDVALPRRAMPGTPERSVPREVRLR